MRSFRLAAALLLAAAPAFAQTPPATPPGSPNPKLIVAGTYKVEPNHSQVFFAVDHFGFSLFRGDFSGASGSLTIDPANLGKTTLSVAIPIASVHTTSAKLSQELASSDWIDAGQFPQATYTATGLQMGPNNTAKVEGNLTLHGVTKPVEMIVHFHGAGNNPFNKALTLGFDGRMRIVRSQFGIGKYVPLVSDVVELTIAGAFEKQ